MSAVPVATSVTPYLTVGDGAAALSFYREAFGAEVLFSVVADDGRLGHAEFTIGDARFMLSDEYPEMGVTSPATLGGTAVALFLDVADVDGLFARVAAAGATVLQEPADQPHGARHGTLVDPFGHRWMLSQTLVEFDAGAYAAELEGSDSGFTFEAGDQPASRPAAEFTGGIWAALNMADAPAGIRFLVDVLGFTEQIVVPNPDDPSRIEHSQLAWPEGGVVQIGSAGTSGNPFSERPTGTESLYVITADPEAVFKRCRDAGVDIVRAPETPDYDPGGLVFTIRDPEGNLFSFGTYGGAA